MKVTTKMLKEACKYVNLPFANAFVKKFFPKYGTFKKALKYTLEKGFIFDKVKLNEVWKNSEDALDMTVAIWLIECVQNVAPERVDATAFESLVYAAIHCDLLIPME